MTINRVFHPQIMTHAQKLNEQLQKMLDAPIRCCSSERLTELIDTSNLLNRSNNGQIALLDWKIPDLTWLKGNVHVVQMVNQSAFNPVEAGQTADNHCVDCIVFAHFRTSPFVREGVLSLKLKHFVSLPVCPSLVS